MPGGTVRKPPVIVIRPPGRGISLGVAELWSSRELLLFMVWRDVKVRYSQTLLGGVWAILQPLITMGIFSLVFRRFIGVTSGGVPYPLFCFAGLIIWMLFAQGLSSAAASLVASQELIQKVYFPRLVLPLATTLTGLVDFAVGLAFLLVMMLAYGVVPGPRALLIVPFVLLALASAIGCGTLLATLNARYRDFHHLTAFLVQVWLIATPVGYPSSLIPEQWQFVAGLNPMAGVVEGFRWALLGTDTFPALLVATSIASSVALMIAGILLFRRMEPSFADII